MIVGNIILGIGITLFRNVGFGVDPFTSMTIAISSKVSLQLGIFQMCLNIGLFAILFSLIKKLIGLGTIINMLFLGYMIQIFSFLYSEFLIAPSTLLGKLILLVIALFLFKVAHLEKIMFYLFIIGNILYYLSGIILAYIFKDNRAFCKYLCPVTIFLKPMSYFSLLRVHFDKTKCINCKKCLKVCPMNVEVNNDSRKRKNATECILCYECVKACPSKALH